MVDREFYFMDGTTVKCKGLAWCQFQAGGNAPRGEQMYGCEGTDSTGIYWVAAIERPTVLAAQGGAVAKIVLPPTAVVAKGRSGALVEAAKLIPSSVTFDSQRTDWMVQRFKGDNA